MTAIVGVVQNKAVWMGADSLVASDYSAWHGTEAKVFVCGPFLIGLCGSPRVAQIVRFKLDLPDNPAVRDPLEFLCVDFIDKVRDILSQNGSCESKARIDAMAGRSGLLVGFRGRLFSVSEDFCVVERAEGFDAIGCGGDLAMGSLYETSRAKVLPSWRIRRALECCERFCVGVRAPFTICKHEGAAK